MWNDTILNLALHCKQGWEDGILVRGVNHTKQDLTWVYNFPREVSTQPLFFDGIPHKRNRTNCIYTYILLREESVMSIFHDKVVNPETRHIPINFRLSRSLDGASDDTCLKIAVSSPQEVTAILLTMPVLTGRTNPVTNR